MLSLTMASEGYTVTRWSHQPDTAYGTRKFEAERSHWIVQGDLEITIMGRKPVILSAGDRDFLPADTYYSIIAVGDIDVVYLVGEKPPEVPKKKRGRPKKNDWIGGFPIDS